MFLPWQGPGLHCLTFSGLSPLHWSPIRQVTRRLSIPSPQVTEHCGRAQTATHSRIVKEHKWRQLKQPTGNVRIGGWDGKSTWGPAVTNKHNVWLHSWPGRDITVSTQKAARNKVCLVLPKHFVPRTTRSTLYCCLFGLSTAVYFIFFFFFLKSL